MKSSALSDPATLVVFATSPAGLGHLRVMNALSAGLPEGTHTAVLGSKDPRTSFLHRLSSASSLGLALLEAGQYDEGFITFFTSAYRRVMRVPSKKLVEKISAILDQQLTHPKTLIVVATHYGLAHQVAVIKDEIAKEKQVLVKLMVQVTDDSPQYPWYVPGADLTIVPSSSTKEALHQYGREAHLPPIKIDVASYPVSPYLSQALAKSELKERQLQLAPLSKNAIELSVPVSGAAVGLGYNEKLLSQLNNHRYHINIVSRQSSYTAPFIEFVKKMKNAHIYTSASDREVVDLYDRMFIHGVIGLEITKPSEQVFKVLLTPLQRGGAILLLAQPVGRQEWDNVAFLRRHNLMPNESAERAVWGLARAQLPLTSALKQQAKYWRALRLPQDPIEAAAYIEWAKKIGLFTLMMSATGRPHSLDSHKQELGSDGVAQFWKKAEKVLQ